ncbi:N utilization substance protein B [Campylobacterota bacterium]|nr:N utilization substance protein B [Campylobacterota bacterium]
MSSARHQARVAAVQLLYAFDMGASAPEKILEENKLADKYKAFAVEMYSGALANLSAIDARIVATINKDWTIERLGRVERAILRLACFELLFCQTDSPIVINEAVMLAKEFADDDAPKLINGMLETVRREKAAQ